MTEKRPPSVEDAKARLMSNLAIDLADLAVLTGTHPMTIRRAAARGDLPVPVSRIGQRWVVPSAPVRELLHVAVAAESA